MFTKNKIKKIIAIAISSLIATSCIISPVNNVYAATNTYGNTNSNLEQGGDFATNGDYIYTTIPNPVIKNNGKYTISRDNYPIYNNEKINKANLLYYYTTNIKVINKNTGKEITLPNTQAVGKPSINIYNGYVYYIGNYHKNKPLAIYRTKIDGTQKIPTRVATNVTQSFVLQNGVIYYVKDLDNGKFELRSYDISSKKFTTKLKIDNISHLSISGNYIYFLIPQEKSSKICKLNIKTNEKTCIKQIWHNTLRDFNVDYTKISLYKENIESMLYYKDKIYFIVKQELKEKGFNFTTNSYFLYSVKVSPTKDRNDQYLIQYAEDPIVQRATLSGNIGFNKTCIKIENNIVSMRANGLRDGAKTIMQFKVDDVYHTFVSRHRD